MPYTPKEGKMIRDINSAWERLEKAEHERELALREELIRQEKLEQLAARFNRKAFIPLTLQRFKFKIHQPVMWFFLWNRN